MVERTVRLPVGDDAPTARLLYGVDARKGLRLLLDASVHCVCTSPPYFGLRDYHAEGQIGLESSPSEFVSSLVEVFQEVKRVLRPDGTLWVNLGDSYAAAPDHPLGVKRKDLIGIPWRVAFAFQQDGWYLRSDIIWQKTNPMPENVMDRPTRSHEYVFMFAHPDSGGRYFYDSESIREPGITDNRERSSWNVRKCTEPSRRGDPGSTGHVTSTSTLSSRNGRNKRTVWSVNPRPYKGAHFATWPPELVGTMIKAGTSALGVCSKCGTPCQVEPACVCNAHSVPATVLDPFSGSATTGYVALRLGRNYVGLDINESYTALAEARVRGDEPPDAQGSVEGSVLDLFGEF